MPSKYEFIAIWLSEHDVEELSSNRISRMKPVIEKIFKQIDEKKGYSVRNLCLKCGEPLDNMVDRYCSKHQPN